ncbi:MAG TPA: ribbon-helix-helix protein, CopG family [Gammaproteobacteria bacterium]|nr:ribbon-helix-helix protein, CopG family [Gammaproteobacteria bacterium]
MKSSTMTVRMAPQTRERLTRLAEAVNRSKSYILNQAIQEYLDTHEWQVLEIEKAVKHADSPLAEWKNHDTVKTKWEKKLAHKVA